MSHQAPATAERDALLQGSFLDTSLHLDAQASQHIPPGVRGTLIRMWLDTRARATVFDAVRHVGIVRVDDYGDSLTRDQESEDGYLLIGSLDQRRPGAWLWTVGAGDEPWEPISGIKHNLPPTAEHLAQHGIEEDDLSGSLDNMMRDLAAIIVSGYRVLG